MPERAQQIGAITYRNVDAVMWERLRTAVPEIIPRGAPGYKQYYTRGNLKGHRHWVLGRFNSGYRGKTSNIFCFHHTTGNITSYVPISTASTVFAPAIIICCSILSMLHDHHAHPAVQSHPSGQMATAIQA